MATNDILFPVRNSSGGFSEKVITPVAGKVLGIDGTGALVLVNAAATTDASLLTSGTLPDARLSTNVPLLIDGALPAVDASALLNVPPPDGLYIQPGSVLSLGESGDPVNVWGSRDVDGDFIVSYASGETQLLIGPNALGPMDGSELIGSPTFTGIATASDSLPGDGTASFSNGAFEIEGGNLYANDNLYAYGTLYAEADLISNGTLNANGDLYANGTLYTYGTLRAIGAIYMAGGLCTGDGTTIIYPDGQINAFAGFSMFDSDTVSVQPATPTTLAEVISLLGGSGYGFWA